MFSAFFNVDCIVEDFAAASLPNIFVTPWPNLSVAFLTDLSVAPLSKSAAPFLTPPGKPPRKLGKPPGKLFVTNPAIFPSSELGWFWA
jgi:hypothetical protein